MTKLQTLTADLLACLRFYSRLPVPVLSFEKEPHKMLDFSSSIRMLPFAGALIGGVSAAVLLGSLLVGLGPHIAAVLAIGAGAIATGAFHEDGLADTADSFGGMSVDRKLDIMRDSRIGTFGGMALVLSTAVKIFALAGIAQYSWALAAGVLISGAAITRVLALMPLSMLNPARTDGVAYSAMQPGPEALRFAQFASAGFLILPLLAGAEIGRILFATVLIVLMAYAITFKAKQLLGGHTGDVAGATQQVTEILFWLVFAAGRFSV